MNAARGPCAERMRLIGRLVIVDYGNYPFIRSLASHMSATGEVRYAYNAGFASPNAAGALGASWETPVKVAGSFSKRSPLRRRFLERRWAVALCEKIGAWDPNHIVIANSPLDAIDVIARWCRHRGIRYTFWMQDVHSYAIRAFLDRKLPFIGRLIAGHYRRLESRLIREAERVILIAEQHRVVLADLCVVGPRVHVFQNWSTLEDFNDAPPAEWRERKRFAGKRLIMYAGTLGMKHAPEVFIALAQALTSSPDAHLVIVSSGEGADGLRDLAQRSSVTNLTVLPFQPYRELPDMLRSATVLLSVLEVTASSFSVPSKVLTYMCAGRPQVLVMPPDNPAAELIATVGAGVVIANEDVARLATEVSSLLNNQARRERMGAAGHNFARAHFRIESIAERFTDILTDANK